MLPNLIIEWRSILKGWWCLISWKLKKITYSKWWYGWAGQRLRGFAISKIANISSVSYTFTDLTLKSTISKFVLAFKLGDNKIMWSIKTIAADTEEVELTGNKVVSQLKVFLFFKECSCVAVNSEVELDFEFNCKSIFNARLALNINGIWIWH